MEQLVEQGLVRNIGLSNFTVNGIRDVLNYSKVKPAVLQNELHPYNTGEKLIRFCRERGIAVTAYSSLGAGSYVQMGLATLEMSCLTDPVIKEIADKHGKSAAQVTLRWSVQRGVSIVPKSEKEARIVENIDIFNGFNLSTEEMDKISGLNRNIKFNDLCVNFEKFFNVFIPLFE